MRRFLIVFLLIPLVKVHTSVVKTCHAQDGERMECPQQHEDEAVPFSSSLAITPDFVERVHKYCNAMVIFDIMDDTFTQNNALFHDGDSFLIRGFPYTLHAGDANAAVMAPQSTAALDDIVLELEDGALQPLLTEAARHLDNVPYLSVMNVSFVAWFADSPLESVQHIFSGAHGDSVDAMLMLPVVLAEASIQIITTASDNTLASSTATNVLLKEQAALLIGFQNKDKVTTTIRPLVPTEEEGANVVLLFSLKSTSTPPKRKTSSSQAPPLLVHFENNTLAPGEIQPIRWARSGVIPTQGAYRMGLPSNLSTFLLEYTRSIGMVDTLERLLYDDPLPLAHVNRVFTFGKNNTDSTPTSSNKTDWYIERPGEYKRFDMLFLVPKDETAHTEFLKALSAAGMDQVIQAVAQYFGWDSAVCVHISLLALTYGDKGGQSHSDYLNTGGDKAFNILIPLILVNESSTPELHIDKSGEALRGRLKYQYHEAVLVGDEAYHATRPCDYRSSSRTFRFFAGVYIADVNEENTDAVTPTYYLAGYPHHDPDVSLRNAGQHWQKNDPTTKLPAW